MTPALYQEPVFSHISEDSVQVQVQVQSKIKRKICLFGLTYFVLNHIPSAIVHYIEITRLSLFGSGTKKQKEGKGLLQ
jgi:hypothetical protein